MSAKRSAERWRLAEKYLRLRASARTGRQSRWLKPLTTIVFVDATGTSVLSCLMFVVDGRRRNAPDNLS